MGKLVTVGGVTGFGLFVLGLGLPKLIEGLPFYISYGLSASGAVIFVAACVWALLNKGAGAEVGMSTQASSSPIFTGDIIGTVNIVGNDGTIAVGVPPEERPPQHDPHAEVLPGLSVHMVVSIHHQPEERRKYILSLGKIGANSAPLYLTPTNQLAFAVTDRNGETYTLVTATGRAGVPFSEFIVLSAELAILADETVMRVSVDGIPVAEQNLAFVVRFDEVKWAENSTIAADTSGANNGRMYLGALFVVAEHLNSRIRDQLFRYYGEQWGIKIRQAEAS